MITCMICNQYIKEIVVKQKNKLYTRYKLSCPDCRVVMILVIPEETEVKISAIISYMDSITKEIE